MGANDDLINLAEYNFRLYHGTEDQITDELITAHVPGGKAPAFKDLAYIIFEDFPLAEYGGSLPNFSFEVIRRPNISISACVEDEVKSIVIIPGTGEYVYDPVIQYKITKSLNNIPVFKEKINSHNHYNLANSIQNLNQLKVICRNIEWISPVACWFGDSLNAGNCRIRPGIEFNEDNIDYSEEWKIANYTRKTARLITRDIDGNPKYGGSVNDASIIRYLKELKNRKLNIMFYPMFFLDIDLKPWRGHLSGSYLEILDFFNKSEGYNDFIIHYAHLTKDYIDAFVIGSELIGLTKVGENGVFPAVNELVNLAKKVKDIVGNKVLVTYAADWSEYHHTQGGWYNLDILWASNYIDFIGIDAYFPVTTTVSSNISPEEMLAGWQRGEGYEYYIGEDKTHHKLEERFAWKNIKYWWENYHYNPDGMITNWVPGSKKIWFTEFGFPSIDKATNQPNVFFDPNCIDGAIPRYSSGEIDFSIQRLAIRSFIKYWQDQKYVENMFLWSWDGRPYPAWPHMNIWRDGYLWERGHWVNNKFGGAAVSTIILELSKKCNINSDKIDVLNLDDSVEGLVINKMLTAIDIINILRISYFFDLKTTHQDKIIFTKRSLAQVHSLKEYKLMKINNNSYLEKIEIDKANIINYIKIYFIDRANAFNQGYVGVASTNTSNVSTISLSLPLIMSIPQAERIGRIILNNAIFENKLIKFMLPINSIEYEAGDVINLSHLGVNYKIRVICITFFELTRQITGLVDELKCYYIGSNPQAQTVSINTVEAKFYIIELSLKIYPELISDNYLIAYVKSSNVESIYANINNISSKFHKISNVNNNAIIGNLVDYNESLDTSIYLIDELTIFTIYCDNFCLINKENNWHLALVGKEIIKFRSFKQIGNNLYQIYSLIRGIDTTEEYILCHQKGEIFILLEAGGNKIHIAKELENTEIGFKITSLQQTQNIKFLNKFSKLPKPYIKKVIITKQLLTINCLVRTYDKWNDISMDQYQILIQIEDNNNIYNFTFSKALCEINLYPLGLSGSLSISIITQNQLGKQSLPINLKTDFL